MELDIADEELRMSERLIPPEVIAGWRDEYPAMATTDDSGEIVSRFRSSSDRGTYRIFGVYQTDLN